MNIRFVFLCVLITVKAHATTDSRLPLSWAEQTLQSMTLDEKIGQVLMIAVPSNPDKPGIEDRLFALNLPQNLNKQYAEKMIKEYHVGGILYICEGNMSEQVAVTNHFQRQAQIPLLVAQDFEPGLVRLLDAIPYPRAKVWGMFGSPSLTYRLGKQLGLQAQRLGVHVIFAPVVDVHTNKKNPIIHDRAFSDKPNVVAEHGEALVKGIQEVGVIACAKHFPGHGDAAVDSHQALPILQHSMERLDSLEFIPFKKVISAGVKAVMPGHLLLQKIDAENPASLSSVFLKKILQEKLGFKGLIFTDALIMKAITARVGVGQAALQSLYAGNTMAVFPDDVALSFEVIKQAVTQGTFSEAELNGKVLLILKAKEQAGLHTNRFVDENNVVKEVNTQQAKALNEELLKNLVLKTSATSRGVNDED